MHALLYFTSGLTAAYDQAARRGNDLARRIPTAPEKRLLVLIANTRRPEDRSTCSVLYAVGTTYGFQIDAD